LGSTARRLNRKIPQFRDADRTRDKIVAVVRAFEKGYAKPLPDVQQIKPLADVDLPGIQVQPDQLPLIDYFVGDLQLRYSFDDPKYISSVSASDLKRLKLKREDLLPLAIANFRRRYPKFKVERMQGAVSVTNAGELEPSLMLDTGFWDLERQRAGAISSRRSRRATAWFSPRGRSLARRCSATARDGRPRFAGNDALSRKALSLEPGAVGGFA
jgi:hypothetical protein